LKICLVGHFGSLDEGVRNVAWHVYSELSKKHHVMKVEIKKPISYKKLLNFEPDVIHLIVGASTSFVFVLAKAISALCARRPILVSALQPVISSGSQPFLEKLFRSMKPDLILVQSTSSEKIFKSFGCRTEFLPNGVNIKRFAPVNLDVKQKLRAKYEIDNNKFVILHVGAVKSGRNIRILIELQKKDNQVILLGRKTTKCDMKILQELCRSGCIVLLDYINTVEEIYQLSDCYVFPTSDPHHSIEIPLSIMEAMSCNLPVISTKFGALTRVFDEGDGLVFVENVPDLFKAIEGITNGCLEVKTREKVLPYSWENIIKGLERIYEELLREKNKYRIWTGKLSLLY